MMRNVDNASLVINIPSLILVSRDKKDFYHLSSVYASMELAKPHTPGWALGMVNWSLQYSHILVFFIGFLNVVLLKTHYCGETITKFKSKSWTMSKFIPPSLHRLSNLGMAQVWHSYFWRLTRLSQQSLVTEKELPLHWRMSKCCLFMW